MSDLSDSESECQFDHITVIVNRGFISKKMYRKLKGRYHICNSYTIGCQPVRGDNPRALTSGLSYVQVDEHGITILYHLHQCVPCTSSDISCLSW